MNRWLSFVPVLGALVSLGVRPAYAQGSERMHANIPFEFKVGHALFPAGRYDVTSDPASAPGVLLVRSQDGHRQAVVLTESVDTRTPKRDPTLVFEREGSVYVLSEVFDAEARTGLEVLGTHATD